MFFKKRKKAADLAAAESRPSAPEPAMAPNAAEPAAAAPPAPKEKAAPAAPSPERDGAVESGHVVFSGEGAQGPMKDLVIGAMKKVFDPEIPIDVYELGLIYRVNISASCDVAVDMTLTSPNCPSAEQIPGDIEKQIRTVDGIADVKVDIVWDPPWDKDKMSEAALLELGFE